MYAQREKPKVYYPPVKTKPRTAQTKEVKPCPQKTVIEYPEMPRKNKYKFNPIDFVPRRKNGDLIKSEIDSEKRSNMGRVGPGTKGVDRQAMINDLQEHQQFENKAAMDAEIAARKRAELAGLSQISTQTDRERREAKFKLSIAQKAQEHYESKYGPNPHLANQLIGSKPLNPKHIRSAQDAELDDLFDSVVEEIEDR